MKKIIFLFLLLLIVAGCVEGKPLPGSEAPTAKTEIKTEKVANQKPRPKQLQTAAEMKKAEQQKVEKKPEKVAYLTFDDGPDDTNTIGVLDVLKQENAVATFYVVGRSAATYPETVKRMHAEGHAVGNHSYDHDYDRLYSSPAAFLAELEQANDILEGIIGIRPVIVRAPGGTSGNFTEAYDKMLEENGYTEHDWNVSSADAAAGHPVAQDFIDNINWQTDDGKEHAIILMHCSEGHEETVKALPGIIQVLREKGYVFRTVTPDTPQPW